MTTRSFEDENHLPLFLVRKRLLNLDPQGTIRIETRYVMLDAVTSTAADYFVIDSTLTNEQLQTICTQLITALETDTLNRFLASKAIAKAIPNWATWTQSDWATYFDDNLSDAQADLVTSFPAARVMIKRQNLVIQNLVKLLIAIRDDIWPDLPEP